MFDLEEGVPVEGTREAAIEWLKALRLHHRDHVLRTHYTDNLRKELEAAGLTPEDVGTSDAEIDGFKNVV